MATLDSFREAAGEPIQLDLANGYIADVRLNSGDVNGLHHHRRTHRQRHTHHHNRRINCALAYNTSPGSDLGDRVTMNAVSGAATATFRAAVPRKALAKPGTHPVGHRDQQRRQQGVLAKLLRARGTLRLRRHITLRRLQAWRIEQLILDADKAIIRINKAVSDARITGGNTTTLDPNQTGHVLAARQRPAARPRPVHPGAARASPAPAPPPWTPTSPPPPACCRPEARATTRSWSACHAAAGSSAWPRTPQPLPAGGRQHVHRRRGRQEPHPRHPRAASGSPA